MVKVRAKSAPNAIIPYFEGQHKSTCASRFFESPGCDENRPDAAISKRKFDRTLLQTVTNFTKMPKSCILNGTRSKERFTRTLDSGMYYITSIGSVLNRCSLCTYHYRNTLH